MKVRRFDERLGVSHKIWIIVFLYVIFYGQCLARKQRKNNYSLFLSNKFFEKLTSSHSYNSSNKAKRDATHDSMIVPFLSVLSWTLSPVHLLHFFHFIALLFTYSSPQKIYFLNKSVLEKHFFSLSSLEVCFSLGLFQVKNHHQH